MLSCTDLFAIIAQLISLAGIYRVYWVAKKRIKVRRVAGMRFLNMLPSFNVMMLKFWIWDINRFFK